MEDFPVALRNTEHVADHSHRQRVRKIGDQVQMTARLDVTDNVIDNGLIARPHIFDPPLAQSADRRRQASGLAADVRLAWPQQAAGKLAAVWV